jgi:hypothetical protein
MSKGRDILTNPNAVSADPTLPAFLARPADKPVYFGFPLVPETLTDGWCFGAITRFEDPSGCSGGDAFVVAPDGTRAGLVWEVGEGSTTAILPPDAARWGVYAVWFPRTIYSVADVVEAFRTVLPDLKELHRHARSVV